LRTKWSRRMKFLFWTTGVLALALVFMTVALAVYESRREIPESAVLYRPPSEIPQKLIRSDDYLSATAAINENTATEVLEKDLNVAEVASLLSDTPSGWISNFEDLLSKARQYEESFKIEEANFSSGLEEILDMIRSYEEAKENLNWQTGREQIDLIDLKLFNFYQWEFHPWSPQDIPVPSNSERQLAAFKELQHEVERLLSRNNQQYDGIYGLYVEHFVRHEDWAGASVFVAPEDWDRQVHYLRKVGGIEGPIWLVGASCEHHFKHHVIKPLERTIEAIESLLQ
jgi:hypothetical protein